MTHDEAVAKLLTLGFEKTRKVGDIATAPSNRFLSWNAGGCCHGWIEIEYHADDMTGPVEVRVDSGTNFVLHFPSLVALVENLAGRGG
jgi:hypothetical protein